MYIKHLKLGLPVLAAVGASMALWIGQAAAQNQYGPGVTDKTIKIGNIAPYSGPVSAYGTVLKAADAYLRKINAEGGINGRTIAFISLDDGYMPAKAVEQVRKLVEQDNVLAIFAPLGTPNNVAVQRYLNARKVPHLFVSSGAHRWGDHKNFPWTMAWNVSYLTEASLYAKHILQTNPAARIGILAQNDDFGKDMVTGLKNGLGDAANKMIVLEQTYEVTDPGIDSQLARLKAANVDTLINITSPKFAALAIKRSAEMGWRPQMYLANVSNSAATVLNVAGLENAKGIISAAFVRDPMNPQWKDSKEHQDFFNFMKAYYPAGDASDQLNVVGYSMAQTLVQTLKQAGNNLTRENLMKEAANLDMTLPMLYPGIRVKTGPNDFYPIEQMQLIRFNGEIYESIGPLAGE